MRRKKPSTRARKLSLLQGAIRGIGMRSTAARVAVLERLQQADAPLSHAQIANDLLGLGLDPATVYRNLTDLARGELISRVEVGDHVSRYEVRADGSGGRAWHPHFLCNGCGRVSCLPRVRVSIRPPPAPPACAVVEGVDVTIRGRCGRCQRISP